MTDRREPSAAAPRGRGSRGEGRRREPPGRGRGKAQRDEPVGSFFGDEPPSDLRWDEAPAASPSWDERRAPSTWDGPRDGRRGWDQPAPSWEPPWVRAQTEEWIPIGGQRWPGDKRMMRRVTARGRAGVPPVAPVSPEAGAGPAAGPVSPVTAAAGPVSPAAERGAPPWSDRRPSSPAERGSPHDRRTPAERALPPDIAARGPMSPPAERAAPPDRRTPAERAAPPWDDRRSGPPGPVSPAPERGAPPPWADRRRPGDVAARAAGPSAAPPRVPPDRAPADDRVPPEVAARPAATSERPAARGDRSAAGPERQRSAATAPERPAKVPPARRTPPDDPLTSPNWPIPDSPVSPAATSRLPAPPEHDAPRPRPAPDAWDGLPPAPPPPPRPSLGELLRSTPGMPIEEWVAEPSPEPAEAKGWFSAPAPPAAKEPEPAPAKPPAFDLKLEYPAHPVSPAPPDPKEEAATDETTRLDALAQPATAEPEPAVTPESATAPEPSDEPAESEAPTKPEPTPPTKPEPTPPTKPEPTPPTKPEPTPPSEPEQPAEPADSPAPPEPTDETTRLDTPPVDAPAPAVPAIPAVPAEPAEPAAPEPEPAAEASPDTVLPVPEGTAAGTATALRAPTAHHPVITPRSAEDGPADDDPTEDRPVEDPERFLATYPWRFHHETLREIVENADELRAVRDQLTEKIDKARDNPARARLLSLRAVASRILGDLGKAQADGKLALAHAEATGELRRIAIAQARLAHVLQWRGDFAEADRLFAEANSPDLPDRLRATMHEHAGRSCYDQGRYMEACNHFERALDLRKVDDPELIARTEVALDAVFAKVAGNGWGPYPRRAEEILHTHRPPAPAFNDAAQRWGYAGADGEALIPPSYAEVQPFREGVAWVRRPETTTWELIDETGDRLIGADAGYVGVTSFSDGLAWVSHNGKSAWVAVDRTNRVVIATGFDDARPFRRGVAAVRRGGWGAVDKNGRTVVPTQYTAFATALTDGRYVEGFTDEGLAVVDAGGRKGVVDRTGRVVLPPRFPDLVIHPVAFLVGSGTGRWGAVDRRGEALIEPVHRSRAEVMDEIDRLLADTKPVL